MRRGGLLTVLHRMSREAARAERARQQAFAREERNAQKIRKEEDRAKRERMRQEARQNAHDAKEIAKRYLENQIEEASRLTSEVKEMEFNINNILSSGLLKNSKIKFFDSREIFVKRKFDESKWILKRPNLDEYLPPPQSGIAKLIPGSAGRHSRATAEARARFDQAEATFRGVMREKLAALAEFDAAELDREKEIIQQNNMLDTARQALEAGDHAAVIAHFEKLFAKCLVGEFDAISAEVGYSPSSRHLVVDLDLPEFSVIPEEVGFKYTKSTDRIDRILRNKIKRKELYSSLVCQIAIKSVDIVFRSVKSNVVDCLTLNGMLEAVDPTNGRAVRLCLLSVRVTEDVFRSLNLANVDPEQCLRSLKASVSRAPTELVPVKPLVELDMVDPRFVETSDVMSSIDDRTNLLDLSPNEFEALITNLFAKMGLDTRQTRPSRDGGVDCVAFDSRPIFGGKVVIQAKRYKNTVGVSAIRDLFGTVQNEGASKGIIVTTSGYGKAAYEFAKGKPLELLDGGNLLHLLAEHAGIDAKIIAPDGWADLPLHGE